VKPERSWNRFQEFEDALDAVKEGRLCSDLLLQDDTSQEVSFDFKKVGKTHKTYRTAN